MACRIPILRFEQYCSTEATIGFFLRIVASFARFFSLLILTSSSRTCSCTQKVSRISGFPLLYCFQLLRHQILHFSCIEGCPDLNRRFRFRSVILNLCHRFSHGKFPLGQIRIHKARSLTRPLAKCFAASAKSNLSRANKFTPCCVNLIQNQTPSFVCSNQCCVLQSPSWCTQCLGFSSSNQNVSLNL